MVCGAGEQMIFKISREFWVFLVGGEGGGGGGC